MMVAPRADAVARAQLRRQVLVARRQRVEPRLARSSSARSCGIESTSFDSRYHSPHDASAAVASSAENASCANRSARPPATAPILRSSAFRFADWMLVARQVAVVEQRLRPVAAEVGRRPYGGARRLREGAGLEEREQRRQRALLEHEAARLLRVARDVAERPRRLLRARRRWRPRPRRCRRPRAASPARPRTRAAARAAAAGRGRAPRRSPSPSACAPTCPTPRLSAPTSPRTAAALTLSKPPPMESDLRDVEAHWMMVARARPSRCRRARARARRSAGSGSESAAGGSPTG